MKHNFICKLLVIALAVLFCVQPFAFGAVAEAEPAAEPIVVIAGSDIQEATLEDGIFNVNSILKNIKSNGYESLYGFLFCGDYSKAHTAMDAELNALKNEVKAQFPNIDEGNMVFLKGNHDEPNTKGLSKSGANDTEHYGVFVINENDYMWYNKSEGLVKKTSLNLEKYLKEKKQQGYDKPVFVASHLALAYNKRTYNDGDGKYAKYIFDVLNKYGDDLNIIFLYGHNHNNQYDNYIGGSTVYLTKGDDIFISKLGKQKETPDKYTLKFTYMNAGYVGATYCLNEKKTMTVFEILGNEVTVKRFSATQQIPLKTKGAWAYKLNETADFFGTTDDYLKFAYMGTEYIGKSQYDNGVTVINGNIKDLKVTKDETNPDAEKYTTYVTYSAESNGYTLGEKAVVKANLPTGYKTNAPVFVKFDNARDSIMVMPTESRVTVETDSFSSFKLFQIKGYSINKGRSAFCPDPVGEVAGGKSAKEQVIGTIYVVSNSVAEAVNITPAMLKDKDGNEVKLTDGTYTDLDIYQGETKIFEGYTLTVIGGSESEGIPAYIWVICIAGAVLVAAAVAVIVIKKKKKA
ncbi:MAG: hypothetical protein IKU23_04205 [Clostridia bacterium]|nr:hypothetical protein [Clostridia bacterium]